MDTNTQNGADLGSMQAMLEAMQAKLATLEAQNARLKAANTRKLTLKVSKQGAVSLYGMGKFPVTLYQEQWKRVLDAADDIRAFIADNVDSLSVKGE